jgi:hypothetical protein
MYHKPTPYPYFMKAREISGCCPHLMHSIGKLGFRKALVTASLAFLSCGFLFGETGPPIVLSHIQGPIKLDGIIDEPAWNRIEPLRMVQHYPIFEGSLSEQTEVLLAYDNNYLYVAGRLYDHEPSKIHASSKQRDSSDPSSDWWVVIIDSFNDKENALAFATTPAGLRWDAAVFNDAQGTQPTNVSWNTFWDVAVSRNNKGWFAEMKIPLSSLRFQEKDGRVVMGLISYRYIARKNECDIFPAIPRRWGSWSIYKPSQAQEIVLENVHSRTPVYVAPYALGGLGQSIELNGTRTAYRRSDKAVDEAGLDVKYGLTNNLTLDLTTNPDFAQVEADDQQVNLTRFSLFFPEKRLFFQERSSIFDFNFEDDESNRLFYSRRIGIDNDRLVRIYGGARLIGRIGPWDIGFLDMQTAPLDEVSSKNYGVFRLRRQVFNLYSYIGGMITSKIGADGLDNQAYGLDGIIRVFGDDYLTIKYAQTFEKDRNNDLFSLASSRIFINWQRRMFKGLLYNLTYSRAGQDYDPGLGFEMRSDFSRVNSTLGYVWQPGKTSPLFYHGGFVDEYLTMRNIDGSVESAQLYPNWDFQTKSGFLLNLGPRISYEDLLEPFSLAKDVVIPPGRYNFYGLPVLFKTPQGKLILTDITLYAGSFYDGRRTSLTVIPSVFLSSSLKLDAYYQCNRVTFSTRSQGFTAHIVRLRALATMSTSFSASSFIQYNSSVGAVIANVRLRYNPREGVDFYLVYNENFNTDRFREQPTLPLSSGRTVMLKATYTFNL